MKYSAEIAVVTKGQAWAALVKHRDDSLQAICGRAVGLAPYSSDVALVAALHGIRTQKPGGCVLLSIDGMNTPQINEAIDSGTPDALRLQDAIETIPCSMMVGTISSSIDGRLLQRLSLIGDILPANIDGTVDALEIPATDAGRHALHCIAVLERDDNKDMDTSDMSDCMDDMGLVRKAVPVMP